MQIANRTTRRYITPPIKNQPGNIRPTNKKPSNVPIVSQSPPKNIADSHVTRPQEPSTLKKLVDRFRYEEPQPRPERESISSDFWWLHDELKNNCTDTDDNEERKSNIPEFIEIFPSTDIDQDLNKRASLLLNQTFSAHSSDTDNVSSTGVGSIPSTTLTTTTTTATFQRVVPEKPARPLFTRNTDSNYNFATDGGDGDILYQWRLRRRLEQAQNNETITFPTKIISRANISPAYGLSPPMPINISTVLPPRPSSPIISNPLSPKRERAQSAAANIETEHNRQLVTASIRTRQYSEVATQTMQDASIQTSLTVDNHLSEPIIACNEIDLRPTRDSDHQSSISHRPPSKSKSEVIQMSTSTSQSPSPTKRHHYSHHHHHRHHSFRPVVVTGQPTKKDNVHDQRSIINSSSIVQSSQDSTLTHVTSIMIHDNSNNNNNNLDNHCPIKDNVSIAVIDEFSEQQDNDDNNIDYLDDEILNMLVKKRDELLVAFRDIEHRLANWKSE